MTGTWVLPIRRRNQLRELATLRAFRDRPTPLFDQSCSADVLRLAFAGSGPDFIGGVRCE
ncbi:MAG: hypothetical protein KA072_04415 [Thermoanaerobaculaceae bacterium]|nr:hypothetical protein [Thermoanaerobaculaceae bacterium]MDI9622573.1 hypothetical protein [Acidobacteriota bacterium]NLH10433.1 hypothetical protein [Holophagae bacterium]